MNGSREHDDAGTQSQETLAGEQIPVPTRRDVLRDLSKVAKSDKPAPTEDDAPSEDE